MSVDMRFGLLNQHKDDNGKFLTLVLEFKKLQRQVDEVSSAQAHLVYTASSPPLALLIKRRGD